LRHAELREIKQLLEDIIVGGEFLADLTRVVLDAVVRIKVYGESANVFNQHGRRLECVHDSKVGGKELVSRVVVPPPPRAGEALARRPPYEEVDRPG